MNDQKVLETLLRGTRDFDTFMSVVEGPISYQLSTEVGKGTAYFGLTFFGRTGDTIKSFYKVLGDTRQNPDTYTLALNVIGCLKTEYDGRVFCPAPDTLNLLYVSYCKD